MTVTCNQSCKRSQPTQFWWAFFSIFDNWKEWKKWCFRSQQMRREGGAVITNWDDFLTAKKTQIVYPQSPSLQTPVTSLNPWNIRQKKTTPFSTIVEHSVWTSELNSTLHGPILFASNLMRGTFISNNYKDKMKRYTNLLLLALIDFLNLLFDI